jgi:uncharacterized protein (TIGR02594 family)
VNNSKIVRMFDRIKVGVNDDETPWCAAFVGNCLEEVGIKSTRSAWALSYADYGVKAPCVPGAIAYMQRKNAAGKVIGGHVAFVVGRDQRGNIMLLGGNQGDKVSVAPFAPSRIMGYRWPKLPSPPVSALPMYASNGKLSQNEA